jgi:pyridoxamine 5'-phosphate oxidase
MDLKKIKLEYYRDELNLEDLDRDPLQQFKIWFDQAIKSEITYPNAATIATMGEDFYPQNRVILIKEVNSQGLVFFTNYDSAKGNQIQNNNKASLNIFWKELDRQIRVNGRLSKISSVESEEYFYSRPRASQISAIASPQSQMITKEELHAKVQKLEKEYPDKLPMPKNWGGYLLTPVRFEFWQGRPNRLHDRFIYENKNGWKPFRVGP